jgi:DNA-binding transcriptional ArsR family regulator
MADTVVVLEPGDERAQKIAKAMGSQTAGDILQLLAEGQKSLTDIAERLSLPMNTAKYHIENLLEAGIIAVEDTRYSVKGREVKMYSLTNQLLIVAPRRLDVRSLLLKYASLFGIIAVASVVVSALVPLLNASSLSAANIMPAPATVGTGAAERNLDVMALKATADTIAPSTTAPPFDPALAFFLGGVLVIFVLLCYEAYLWKMAKR